MHFSLEKIGRIVFLWEFFNDAYEKITVLDAYFWQQSASLIRIIRANYTYQKRQLEKLWHAYKKLCIHSFYHYESQGYVLKDGTPSDETSPFCAL